MAENKTLIKSLKQKQYTAIANVNNELDMRGLES